MKFLDSGDASLAFIHYAIAFYSAQHDKTLLCVAVSESDTVFIARAETILKLGEL